jgi:ABC-type spermidine/putrescine transport system permease subunit I
VSAAVSSAESFSAQKIAGYGVATVAAVLVLYPVFYLLQAALDVGDPQTRPPTAYGFDNFAALLNYPQIMLNTLSVSFAATLMALVIGFIMAWILTRTNVPGRRVFEQLMAVPFYLTPLLGALAWSMLGSPESGFINQYWRALGGSGHLIDINTPYGIAWVMALFEGSVAFVMIGAVMKSMDPSLEEASQIIGASRLRTMLRVTLPLVTPGVRPRAWNAKPLLRHHHRNLPVDSTISAAHPGRSGDGDVAVRGDVRDDLHLPAHRYRGQLCHYHRQGVPAGGRRRWSAALPAVWCMCALSGSVGGSTDRHIAFCIGPEDRRRISCCR